MVRKFFFTCRQLTNKCFFFREIHPFFEVHSYKNYVIISEFTFCIHCHLIQSSKIPELLEHCRTCADMLRPDKSHQRYVCYSCTYSTFYTGNMKKHISIHIGEKPYACEFCNYKAVEKKTLVRHISRNHKNKLLPL